MHGAWESIFFDYNKGESGFIFECLLNVNFIFIYNVLLEL
jgi:hypothetical protein